ncbi:MAG: hypothetical protein M3383_09970 [Actinomycetota bacterium]|nr:hypothetical protein [Actinomycetota bacterium]
MERADIAALAEAGAILGREDFSMPPAVRRLLLTEMRDEDGRLLRTYKAGRARLNARARASGPRQLPPPPRPGRRRADGVPLLVGHGPG